MGGVGRDVVDAEVQSWMEWFEQCPLPGQVLIEPRRPRHVLLAVDSTSQDAPTIGIAQSLRSRFHCGLSVVDAREGEVSRELAARAAAKIGGKAMPRSSGSSSDQVLAAIEQSGCDLLVIPCPYGDRLESVGSSSTGTVVNALLANCGVPLVVVRQPFGEQEEHFSDVLQLALPAPGDAGERAADWAVGMVVGGGTLRMAIVAGDAFRRGLEGLMESPSPGMKVKRRWSPEAMVSGYVGLHRGMQQAASEGGFRYGLEIWREDQAALNHEATEGGPLLVVASLDRADSAALEDVRRRIQHSAHPWLVVPS